MARLHRATREPVAGHPGLGGWPTGNRAVLLQRRWIGFGGNLSIGVKSHLVQEEWQDAEPAFFRSGDLAATAGIPGISVCLLGRRGARFPVGQSPETPDLRRSAPPTSGRPRTTQPNPPGDPCQTRNHGRFHVDENGCSPFSALLVTFVAQDKSYSPKAREASGRNGVDLNCSRTGDTRKSVQRAWRNRF